MGLQILSWNSESIFLQKIDIYGDYLKNYMLGMLYVKLNFEYYCFNGKIYLKFLNLLWNFVI